MEDIVTQVDFCRSQHFTKTTKKQEVLPDNAISVNVGAENSIKGGR